MMHVGIGCHGGIEASHVGWRAQVWLGMPVSSEAGPSTAQGVLHNLCCQFTHMAIVCYSAV